MSSKFTPKIVCNFQVFENENKSLSDDNYHIGELLTKVSIGN